MRATPNSAVVIGALCVLDIVAASAIEPVRAAIVLGVMVMVPGAALMANVLPFPIARPTWIVIAAGLGLAVDTAIAYLLTLSPWGIGAVQWLVSLAVVVLILVARVGLRHGFLRRKRMARPMLTFRAPRVPLLPVALCIGIATLAVIVRLTGAQPGADQPVQFWMLAGDQPGQLAVGLTNLDSQALTVRVEITTATSRVVTYPVVLQPDGGWSVTFDVAPTDYPVRAYLDEASDLEPLHREVVIQRPGDQPGASLTPN